MIKNPVDIIIKWLQNKFVGDILYSIAGMFTSLVLLSPFAFLFWI